MAGVALGILNACLDASVRFAKERTLYGNPMSDLQAIQMLIAGIYADLEASRMICYHAAWLAESNIRDDAARALAKYFTTEAAVRSAKAAIDLHGGYGVLEDYTVQRLWRDAQACIAPAGTSQVMQLVMARQALR
jgi:alkylation response protein AidB-like acyl-CoA dehydrogenase